MNMHADLQNQYEHYRNLSTLDNGINNYVAEYVTMVNTTGVAKREPVRLAVANVYGKQITTLVESLDSLAHPEDIYNRLQAAVTKDGSDSTKYVYLSTLQNFLTFMKIRHPQIESKNIETLEENVMHWLQRQRRKKEKRHNYVKQLSRQKLDGLPLPFKAVEQYEKATHAEITSIQDKTNLRKIDIEKLYADVFLKIICKLGCRPGSLTGMTQAELLEARKLDTGEYSIQVKRQKEQRRPACVVVSAEEKQDIVIASNRAWSFLKKVPEPGDPLFPSLGTAGFLMSAEFARIFYLRSAVAFGQKITATDVRKLITTHMRNKPAEIQSAVARAEGHSINVASRYYDVSEPHEVVQRARNEMKKLANGKFWYKQQPIPYCMQHF